MKNEVGILFLTSFLLDGNFLIENIKAKNCRNDNAYYE